jgi:hypothetical protein
VPEPDPDAPPVTVIQASLETAVQGQSACVVTPKDPVPAHGPKPAAGGLIEKLQVLPEVLPGVPVRVRLKSVANALPEPNTAPYWVRITSTLRTVPAAALMSASCPGAAGPPHSPCPLTSNHPVLCLPAPVTTARFQSPSTPAYRFISHEAAVHVPAGIANVTVCGEEETRLKVVGLLSTVTVSDKVHHLLAPRT